MSSSFSTASSSHLKRTWSGTRDNTGNRPPEGTTTSTPRSVPPLPAINGEILLQVLTHRSLRRDGVGQEFDNERLAELGKQVLDTAITATLFNRRPVLSGLEMLQHREKILSEENLDGWVSMYGLREKVRCTANVLLHSPEETRGLFFAYVAGLYIDSGVLETVQNWLDALISDKTSIQSTTTTELSPTPLSTTNMGSEYSEPPPYAQKRMKPADPVSIFFASQPPPSSISSSMPFIPTPPTVYPHGYNNQPQSQYPAMAPSFAANPVQSQAKLGFLARLNQTASQRRLTVEYPAEFSGLPHSGQWTVRCSVNGITKGIGTGGSKQISKEEAARQAWYNLGFGDLR